MAGVAGQSGAARVRGIGPEGKPIFAVAARYNLASVPVWLLAETLLALSPIEAFSKPAL
jgi:hypothetical protein